MSSETVVQQQTRLRHIELTHGQAWRNNSGACIDETGRLVRYGLGNDSAALNKEIKSSDLICITPTLITPAMVGYYLGVFTAYEIKPSGWVFPRPTNKEEYARACAQGRYHDIVRASCGYAGFVTDPRDIERIIGRA